MLEISLFILVVVLAYLSGTIIEHHHYRSLARREQRLASLPICDSPETLISLHANPSARLVVGNVVVSLDMFRRVMAGFGSRLLGRVESYEALLDRARREAVLRMKTQAARLDAAMVCNVRLETTQVLPSWRGTPRAVEVLAYGTALIPAERMRAVPVTRSPLLIPLGGSHPALSP